MESFDINEEFNQRVKHNFRLYVLLSSKSVHWSENRVLEGIWRLNGYRSHKAVKYGKNSSHIHVKFDGERSARRAVKILNKLNSDLTAILVEDMLKGWFDYEIRVGGGPKWTLTIVDILGDPPLSLNFLTSNIVNYIFEDFGAPFLLPYTSALKEPHVQVLFGSMTQALAACMAFGEWYRMDSKMDSFSYRVRINPSDREAYLIRNSGGTPKEAFKLDYFVSLRDELYQNSRSSGCDSSQGRALKNKMTPYSKGTLKVRQQKPSLSKKNLSNVVLNQLSQNTPILCVPIIAPLNKFTEAMTGTSNQLNSDFSTAVLNFQQTLSVSSQSNTSNTAMGNSYSATAGNVSRNREMEISYLTTARNVSSNREMENSYSTIESNVSGITGMDDSSISSSVSGDIEMENSYSAIASKSSSDNIEIKKSYSAIASKSSSNNIEIKKSYSAIASECSVRSIVEDLEQPGQNSEKVLLKDITPRGDEDIILNCPPAQTRKKSMKTKSTFKCARVFERRT